MCNIFLQYLHVLIDASNFPIYAFFIMSCWIIWYGSSVPLDWCTSWKNVADEIINITKSPCCIVGIYDNDPLLLKTIGANHRPKFCSPSMTYCSHPWEMCNRIRFNQSFCLLSVTAEFGRFGRQREGGQDWSYGRAAQGKIKWLIIIIKIIHSYMYRPLCTYFYVKKLIINTLLFYFILNFLSSIFYFILL